MAPAWSIASVPQGKGYVLFEAPRREITSLAVGANGTIYAASVGDKSRNPLPPLPVQGVGHDHHDDCAAGLDAGGQHQRLRARGQRDLRAHAEKAKRRASSGAARMRSSTRWLRSPMACLR